MGISNGRVRLCSTSAAAEALHKHCCGKGGIGIRPPYFLKEWLETPQSSGLSGTDYPDSTKVLPRRDLCPLPVYLQRWLGSQFSYECVETTLLLPSSIPGFNLSIFLLLQEMSWNIPLTFFRFTAVSLLALFSPPEHLRLLLLFLLPLLPSPDLCMMEGIPILPHLWIPSAAGLFFQKTWAAADK